MTTLIQIDSMAAAKLHGNLWNSPSNQLRRKVGRYSTVYVGERSGTIRDQQGKCWDWWLLDNGTVEVAEAH